MDTSLARLLGRKFVFGLTGPDLLPEDIDTFRETQAEGLILYRRNYRSPEQVKKLISDLENAVGRKLYVCLDHEGGRVVMMGGGLTVFPDPYAFGLTGKPELVHRQGEIEAVEMRAMGFDVNLSPVLDLMADNYNPGTLTRAYSKSEQVVAVFAAERIKGLQSGGISACAKHFPGKGHACVDAHLKLPLISSTLEEMEARHLKPFIAAIEAGVECVMSSHPLYEKIDPSGPATFSKKIITGLLRERYGYKGVIMSDDLEMGAVSAVSDVAQATVKAEAAGHDVLLVCHAGAAQKKAFHSLYHAYSGGELDKKVLEKSVERIAAMTARRAERFAGNLGPAPEGLQLSAQVARSAVKVVSGGKKQSPLAATALKGKNILVSPRFSDISATVMFEPGMENVGEYFLSKTGLKPYFEQHLLLPVEPKDADIEKFKAALSGCDTCVIFVWDAGLFEGWRKAFELAQDIPVSCVAVLMRDMFDQRFVKPSSHVFYGHGYRKCQLDAVIELMAA